MHFSRLFCFYQRVLLDVFDTDEDGKQRSTPPEDEAVKMGPSLLCVDGLSV